MKKIFFYSFFALAIAAGCKNDNQSSLVSNANAASISNTGNNAAASSTTNVATTSSAPAQQIAAKVDPLSSQLTPSVSQNTTNPNGKVTTVKFEELSYDWGTLEEGKSMTHIFKFKNTGKEDLIISDARGSCGCTVPEWPKEPIKAGESSDIKVVFNSAGKGGAVNKTVTITANSDPSPITLVIKGIVEPKKASN